ncbi:MBL fold metallo-hydrolase [Sphingomonas mali]|uniref:MBL fold metallo-hydrolase n=1 Tax=Sphingomonas mali TaxID=40682 RepID=UPI000A61376C|nr:MBL fold metallo-hydrolase [Sphingomonas mali]
MPHRGKMQWVKRAGAGLLWLVILLCLAIAIIPEFLDARYYRGPVSDHFDGEHFFNPDGADDALSPPGGTGTLLRYVTARDNRPLWPDRVAVTPTKPSARVDGERMLATWVGHATVLVQTNGLNILTDPVWSKSAGPFGIGPTRVAEPGIRFADLPKIDLVLVSHDHYDHMDLATLRKLWDRDHPLIVTSLGNDSVIGQAGVPARALDWGGEVAVRPGVSVVVNRSHHWDSRWFADRNRALWSGFVVRLPGGNLFFAGDTGAGDFKWADRAASYGPIRLALIPIGAFRFAAGQMAAGSHVGPVDAVEMYRRLGAAHAIAIHWGTFRLSYEGWDTPPRLLAAAEACTGQRGFAAVRIGRTMEIPAFAPQPSRPAMARSDLLRCLDTPAMSALR